MPRDTEELNDDKKEHSQLREWAVLATIIWLNSLGGMAASVEQAKLKGLWNTKTITFFQLCHTLVPITSSIGISMISELHGRKPIFIILYSLSIVGSVFRIMSQETCLFIALFIQGLVWGGTMPMTFLAISEYSNPKHRFVYLMLNAVARQIVATGIYILYEDVLDKDSVYVSGVMVVLGLVGLGSVFVWPESPYWLSARGRRVDAACTLRRLRGVKAGPELTQLANECRSPGPVKLYWLSLFIAISTVSISLFVHWQDVLLSQIYYNQQIFISFKLKSIISIPTAIISFSLIAVVSYKIKRKVLYLITASVPLIISFVLVAWNRLEPIDEKLDYKSFYIALCIAHFLRKCGPSMIAMALFIEVIPFKYNCQMSCICFVCYNLINILFTYEINEHKSASAMKIFSIMLMVLSPIGIILYHWLAPETKDRTLLEIQNSYTPKKDTTPELHTNQIGMQNMEDQNVIERL